MLQRLKKRKENELKKKVPRKRSEEDLLENKTKFKRHETCTNQLKIESTESINLVTLPDGSQIQHSQHSTENPLGTPMVWETRILYMEVLFMETIF